MFHKIFPHFHYLITIARLFCSMSTFLVSTLQLMQMSDTALLIRLGIFLLILVLIDVYVFQGIRTLTTDIENVRTRRWIHAAYWGITVMYFVLIGMAILNFNPMARAYPVWAKWVGMLLVLIWLPKLILATFLLLEDVYRAFYSLTVFAFEKLKWGPEGNVPYVESRRKFVSQVALGVAAIPFLGTLYGITKGKYDYKVHKLTLFFKDLPPAFDGFTLTQISDVHAGSFDNTIAVEKGIQMINDLKSDVVLFTGDLVNNIAAEFDDWVDVFAKINAPMGKYSCLGNHDYGEYVRWESMEKKRQNLKDLMEQHSKIGFRLLNNENIHFNRNGEHLAIIGVENWGLPPFPQLGDLDQAVTDIPDDTFKILLSHDPTHWQHKVLPHPQKIHLTLSGHTHGMQFGVEIPGWVKWSPVQFKYPQWAGLYQTAEQYLYVNRGFGFIGFSGRVGIWPEITHITLKRG